MNKRDRDERMISRLSKVILVLLIVLSQMTVFASNIKMPVSADKKVIKNEKAVIDVSNMDEGYVMAKYIGQGSGTIKLIIQKIGGSSYTYNIFEKDKYEAFPLTEGNGEYKITVYEGVGGSKYSTANGTTEKVSLKNELSPFLYPNQYVWFNKDSSVVALAENLVGKQADTMEKVKGVYEYVVKNFSYDYAKAKNVKSGYICDIDNTLKTKKGICLDYSAVMAAMLRSQGVPTKLIVGYAGTQYHAWISVYSKEEGWIENVIYFDGRTWTMMDPTMASTSKKPDFKMDEKKYSAKYAY